MIFYNAGIKLAESIKTWDILVTILSFKAMHQINLNQLDSALLNLNRAQSIIQKQKFSKGFLP